MRIALERGMFVLQLALQREIKFSTNATSAHAKKKSTFITLWARENYKAP